MLTVTATNGPTQLTAIVVGHCGRKLPKPIEEQAARIAAGTIKAPCTVATDGGLYVLVKPDTKPWLVGGEAWRIVGSQIAEAARAHKAEAALVLVEGRQAQVPALVEGLVLGDYRFIQLRSGDAAKRAALTIRLPGFAAEVRQGVAIAQAQNLARELADLPGNLLNPATFVERVRRELRGTGIVVKVVSGEAALRRAGFPGLAQVGQAGSTPPQLVELRLRPARSRATGPHLGLIGKGITFDSGGISLKPGDKMWEMKADMSGAAAVFATMRHLAQHRPQVPVTAWLCLAENMPDSRAQRPGDIYRTRTGTTVHVDNTDAEGRLVLADVLTYAGEQGCTHLVDVATLTGACVVALGERIGGLMGQGDDWLRQVRAAGQDVGEELWQLPLYGDYRSLLDHAHADINNVGGRWGGAITAGIFLSEFVKKDVAWAHLDIAGPAMATGGWRYFAKGMTGFGTRTLIRLAQTLA